MDANDYQAPDAGRILRTAQGYHAFVPAPLPPSLQYTPAFCPIPAC